MCIVPVHHCILDPAVLVDFADIKQIFRFQEAWAGALDASEAHV